MENIQGKKIIPVSSKKQKLNTQRTGNYFHSVYIVFTTISIAFTPLGIVNNLSRDDLEYMGGPHGLYGITLFYTWDSADLRICGKSWNQT